MSKDKKYDSLVKAELIELLINRDTEISTLQETTASLQANQNQNENTISTLQQQLQDCQDNTTEIKTAEQLIKAVLSLPEDQVRVLPSLIRTSDKGVEAFAVFNYGALPGLISI